MVIIENKYKNGKEEKNQFSCLIYVLFNYLNELEILFYMNGYIRLKQFFKNQKLFI